LIHNCLSYAAIDWSDNDYLRDKVSLITQEANVKIGFAWTEKEPTLGSINFVDWTSTAKLSEDQKSWIISGAKSFIIKDDYNYYAIFCKTSHYPDDEVSVNTKSLAKGDHPMPGIVGFLVPAKMIGCIEDEEIINGIVYQKIKFDSLLLNREDYQLVDASPLGIRSLNIRGIGLLGTSSYICGQLKTLLRECYRYLIDHKNGLLDCQSIERILCDVTYKIYSLESCIFLTAQMYDAFDNIDSDPEMHIEASICKILAIEYSREILHLLQSVYGSKLLITSPLHDMINIFDSFIEGSLHHRLLISTWAMHFLGYMKQAHIFKERMTFFYPIYVLKQMFIRRRQMRDKPLLSLDLKGYVHPSLQNQADQLEYCVHQFEFEAERVLIRWGKDQPRHQNDLERLTQIAIDIFLMTCTLSRGSRAYCDGFRNSDIDFRATVSVVLNGFLRVRQVLNDLNYSDTNGNEIRNRDVHRANIKHGGYFASSPLEKFYY
jgi:AGAP000454-PA